MNEQTQRLNRERRFLVLLGVICLALIGGCLLYTSDAADDMT